ALCTLFLLAENAAAANFFTRTAGGAWSTPTTWSQIACNGTASGSPPAAADNATICHAVFVTSTTSITNLTINTGGSVTVNNGVTLIVTGTFSNNGNVDGPGTIQFNSATSIPLGA